ncbi:MAG: DEAD/DEAH box helicase family protein, partial [Caldilineaceae bacterium]|nr:DEAD/DEAH box helicase family protein [Caldilineaceae bacterium]
MTAPHLAYLGGTLVLHGIPQDTAVPAPFQWLDNRYRCEAVHYRAILPWLHAQQIENRVPGWHHLALALHDGRAPHDYQLESLAAWADAGRWGSIVLPTGAGKTFVALHALAETAVSSLVVVPTIDLLHQWYARLENAFRTPIGVWYGQEKALAPITVTTYHSGWAHAETFGNRFGLLIFDEIHHLPAPTWHEIALICAAPHRLGLTATYPDGHAEAKSRSAVTPHPSSLLAQLVGPVVYRKEIDDLTGAQLAEYRTERMRVELTPAERAEYDAAYAAYTGYVREARLRESHGPGWWREFTRRSAYEVAARRAKVAELRLKEIVHQAAAKLELVDALLR